MSYFSGNLLENLKNLPTDLMMHFLDIIFLIDKPWAMYLETKIFKSSALIEEFLEERKNRLQFFNLPENFNELSAEKKLITYCYFEVLDVKYFSFKSDFRRGMSAHYTDEELEALTKASEQWAESELKPFEDILFLFADDQELMEMGYL